MHGTGPGGRQQHPSVIFVQHAGDDHGEEIADRIGAETPDRKAFLGQRQYLPQQGVARIAGSHARDKPARHAQGKQSRGGRGGRQPLIAQAHSRQQLGGVGDGAGQGRLPDRDLP